MTKHSTGVLLAIEDGMELRPATQAVPKCLLPVFDKPMVFYPLSVLMLAGVQQVLIVTTEDSLPAFERLLGNGRHLGLSIVYVPHAPARPVIRTLVSVLDLLEGSGVVFIDGDTIFFGSQFEFALFDAVGRDEGATVFAKMLRRPRAVPTVELDDEGRPTQLFGATQISASHAALTGLGIYDDQFASTVADLSAIEAIEPAADAINEVYLHHGKLQASILGRDSSWFFLKRPEDLLAASVFVEMVEAEFQCKIGCPEEVSFRRGLITAEDLLTLAERIPTSYGRFLRNVALRRLPLRLDP